MGRALGCISVIAVFFVASTAVSNVHSAEEAVQRSCLDSKKQIECLDKKLQQVAAKLDRLDELERRLGALEQHVSEEIKQELSKIESELGKTAKYGNTVQLKGGSDENFCLLFGGKDPGSQKAQVILGQCTLDDSRNFWTLRKR